MCFPFHQLLPRHQSSLRSVYSPWLKQLLQCGSTNGKYNQVIIHLFTVSALNFVCRGTSTVISNASISHTHLLHYSNRGEQQKALQTSTLEKAPILTELLHAQSKGNLHTIMVSCILYREVNSQDPNQSYSGWQG